MEKKCNNKDFCRIVMASEKHNILEFNQYIKPDKIPYIIYAKIEFSIKERWMCEQSKKFFNN